MLNKAVLFSFVLAAIVGIVLPWFIDFKAIDPKYSAIHAVVLLASIGVCLALSRLDGFQRQADTQKEVDHDADS